MQNRSIWPAVVAILLVPVLYIGSFGPACWATSVDTLDAHPRPGMVVYWPLGAVAQRNGTTWYGNLLRNWMLLGVPYRSQVAVPMNASGTASMAIGNCNKPR